MAQQNINQGNPPIVWSTVDDAFQKINANFTELYLSIGGSGVDLTSIASSLIPDSNEARDLGSIDNRWRDLYLSSSSIYLGSALITADISGAVNLPAGSTVGGSLIKDPVESSFKIVRVSGQSDVVADDATDILNLVGSGIAITTNDLTDTVTFTNSGIVSAAAGTGISVAGANPLIITNTGVRSISGTSGEIGVSSSTGAVTLTNLGVTRLSTDPGSGITLSGNTGNIQITNAAPNVVQDVFKNIAVLGQSTITATGPNSTLTVAAGNGISLTTVATFGLETLSIVNSGIISISVDSSLTYSVVSGAANLSLASTISRNLIGNVTGILTGSVVGNIDGDVNGSVFADDSTLLVDGVSGKIVGDVETARLRTSETAIALGGGAGEITQGVRAVAIGDEAGRTDQGVRAVAIGYYAGQTNQSATAVAIGDEAGRTNQGIRAVAMGYLAGGANQGAGAVAIGDEAGRTNQGANAIAIGNLAGQTNQTADSIVINASGVALDGSDAGFYVNPIREVTGPQTMYYDPATYEVTWGPVPAGSGGDGGGGFGGFKVAADDSTQRFINDGETVKFIGSNGISTASDAEGAITISGNNTFQTFSVAGQSNVVADSSSDTLTLVAGTGIQITTNATTDTITVTNSSPNVVQDVFTTISVAGQTNVVADNSSDTLTLVAGTGIQITTNASTDTVTITNFSPNIVQNVFTTIAVAGQSNVVADSSSDTLTLVAGTGISITTNATTDTVTIANSGSPLSSRTTATGNTGSIANAATANVTITGFKGYLLYKIQTSAAAWVRLYTSVAARTADSSRLENEDPLPGAGVIAEIISTSAETMLITPGTIGFNDESSPNTNIELAVTNKSGSTADITVTLTIVKVEV